MKYSLFMIFFVLLFILYWGVAPLRADLDRSKINKGIQAYDQNQWDESLKHFQDALLDAPGDPVAHYNVAEALYKKQKYEDALSAYEKALNTPDVDIRQKVHYNMGNTYYQMNKYQEAIQSYIKALELNPEDQDAKHNLELVRAKLKEMAQKQPMQNQQQQQQQQGQSGEQQQQEGQQQQNQDQSGEQQQQQQEQQQQMAKGEKNNEAEQQEMQEKQMQQAEKKKELSKEEAERILQALRSDEKENQKLRRSRAPAGRARVEKDW